MPALDNTYIKVSQNLLNMEYAIAKVSSKGQIVIPRAMRSDIHQGDEFLVVKEEGRFVLKNLKDVASDLKDDLKFAAHVEKAWQDYEAGKFKSMSKEDFLKELKKW